MKFFENHNYKPSYLVFSSVYFCFYGFSFVFDFDATHFPPSVVQ